MDFWHAGLEFVVLVFTALSIIFLLTIRNIINVKKNQIFAHALYGIVFLMLLSFVITAFTKAFYFVTFIDLHNLFIVLGLVLFILAIWELSGYIDEIKALNIKLIEKTNMQELDAKQDEAIFSSIGESVVVVDQETNILKINKQAERLLGYKAKNYIGKKLAFITKVYNSKGEFIPPEKRALHEAIKLKKRISLTPMESDLYLERKDGSRFPFAPTVSPLIVDGKVKGAVGVFWDITEEKAIDKAKTEFMSIASHQLKTPLTTINWYTEMLRNGDAGKLNRKQDEFIKNISDSTQRLIDLVNALLQVSRIESGRLDLNIKNTDFKELFKACCADVKMEIEQKNIKTVLNIDKNLPKLKVDPKLIHTALQNILLNSVKYTPHNGTIQIECHKNHNGLIISFMDTGYGIPKSEQSKIFTKMFRASNIVSKVPAGTGLGLYIAKAIIEKSGGTIWFESEEGKGTTFYIKLPIVN